MGRSAGPLGRRVPKDFEHVSKYSFAAVAPATVITVNRTLVLPKWHWTHDQGHEGSCVGHGTAMERAITNGAQNKLLNLVVQGRRYDPLHIWNQAKEIDEWPDTNPGDDNGTSVRAAYDVLRVQGARRIKSTGIVLNAEGDPVVTDLKNKPDPAEGVLTNRWATTVDEIRTAISRGIPVAIGVNWYSAFDDPFRRNSEMWVMDPLSGVYGTIRGGHCVCIYGASDKRQAFRVKNSWGKDYPLAWLPYRVMGRLLREDGEAALVTDR